MIRTTGMGMIQFTLKCSAGHRFDSWFGSAEAFDKLRAAGMVACSVCGTTEVDKAPMAPHVSSGRKTEATTTDEKPQPETRSRPLTQQAHPAEQALARLRRHVEAHSEYVGADFAREARDMHAGIAPERAIHGEARAEEARALIEDGVPVAPLPFRTDTKSN